MDESEREKKPAEKWERPKPLPGEDFETWTSRCWELSQAHRKKLRQVHAEPSLAPATSESAPPSSTPSDGRCPEADADD